MNHSALIQVYTEAKDVEGSFVLQRYRAIYPSTAVGGVLFYAGKTYYNTGIKGNFTFKIFGSQGEVDQASSAVDSSPDAIASRAAAIDDTIDAIATGTKKTGIRPPGAKKTVSGSRSKR